MNPEVTAAVPLPDYKLRVSFSNNEIREFDVSPFLSRGIFVELKNEAYFRQVRVAYGAVEWPNEQDFSKDTLYLLGSPVTE